jgi:hypothetical protein
MSQRRIVAGRLLVNPTDRTLAETLLQEVLQAAARLGCSSMSCMQRDFDTVFATTAQRQAGALVIGADSFFVSRSKQLAAFAAGNLLCGAGAGGCEWATFLSMGEPTRSHSDGELF